MGDEKSQSSQSTMKLGLWLGFAAFLLIVLVFRTKITEISFGDKGVSAKMLTQQEVNSLSPADRKNGEDQLADRVNALEAQAKANPQPQTQTLPESQPQAQSPSQTQFTDATYQQPALPNLAGYWMSPSGLTYQVNQYGNYLAISEVNGGVVQAVATGQIMGWSFSLPSYNLAGRSGVLSLQVSADQRRMAGQYQDVLSGSAVPMELSR
jgi:hypothetical protein